jgi:arylsulfatase A-like enzyme
MNRPNVVLVCCDDLGYGELGCCGSPTFPTPHIDRLASLGVRFRAWYASAPVCSASLAGLLTGKHPAKAGVRDQVEWKGRTKGLPPGERTLAAMLRDEGYETGLFGKWHLGLDAAHHPNAHGFNRFCGFLSGQVDYFSHVNYWHQLRGGNPVHDLWDNDQEIHADGQYATEWIAGRACIFIEQQLQAGTPFFAMLSFNAPHWPLHTRPAYLERFAQLPGGVREKAAKIAAVDDAVGAVIALLERYAALDRTVIVLTSDNGPSNEQDNWLDGRKQPFQIGDNGGLRGWKGSLFEGGIRVPGIVAGDGRIRGGRIVDAPVTAADLVPTLAELIGFALPQEAQLAGRSFCPLLMDRPMDRHDPLMWEYRGQLAIRRGDWKLVLHGMEDLFRPAADAVWLSNLASDAEERVNLADARPEIVQELTELVTAWYADAVGKDVIKDVAFRKQASAGTPAIPGYEPERVLDGDIATYWAAPGTQGERWWMVDLGSPHRLVGTEMSLGWQGRFHYYIETSADGRVWQRVVDKSERTADTQYHIDDFQIGGVRYVRVVFCPGSHAVIRTFRVLGTAKR